MVAVSTVEAEFMAVSSLIPEVKYCRRSLDQEAQIYINCTRACVSWSAGYSEAVIALISASTLFMRMCWQCPECASLSKTPLQLLRKGLLGILIFGVRGHLRIIGGYGGLLSTRYDGQSHYICTTEFTGNLLENLSREFFQWEMQPGAVREWPLF